MSSIWTAYFTALGEPRLNGDLSRIGWYKYRKTYWRELFGQLRCGCGADKLQRRTMKELATTNASGECQSSSA